MRERERERDGIKRQRSEEKVNHEGRGKIIKRKRTVRKIGMHEMD